MRKKTIPYILILAVLAGIFGIAQDTRAADPMGTCITDKGTYKDSTKKGCDLYAEANGERVIKWVINCTAPKVPSASGDKCVDPDPMGTCVTDKQTYPATKKGCDLYASLNGQVVKSWTITCTPPKVPQNGSCVSPKDPSGGESPQKKQEESKDPNYYLLSPLPCDKDKDPGCTAKGLETYDPTGAGGGALGGYLNVMIKIFIGICAVLAMIMIVIGGLEYMTSELPGNKESGKNRITQAVLGLLLALGAWLILYTINPALLDANLKNLGIAKVTVTLDEANFAKTEGAAAKVGTKYTTSGSTSPGVSAFVAKNCSSLSKITVNVATKKANFCAGSSCVAVSVNLGLNGVAETGQGTEGDLKTPKGTSIITGDRRFGSGVNAVLSRDKLYNLGAAFINTGITTAGGKDRGIGFHGSYDNNLGTTNGCIRMSNDDIAALAPCMKAGTQVIIQ